ncbi:MAG: DUF481 domain-containing protein [Candidatus Latescibacteria bacterium]|nr:DUF481 domain-containing protein [Candidatus Latescibacterota bacterium]
MSPRYITIAATLLAVAMGSFASLAHARQKTDLVYLANGDRMTGEIKKLDRGILELKTNDIGTVNIEWEDVDSLNSVYHFRVEDNSGIKHFGAIFLTRAGQLQVIRGGQVEQAPQINVVTITPLEASFWQQLDGSINVGYNYTQSNNLGQLTADVYVVRKTEIRLWALDFGSITTSQEDEETNRREDLTFSYNRLFEGPLFALASAAAQRNDELGLDLRVLFSSGIGANLVQSNHNDLLAALGLSVNREWSDAVADNDYNLEAFLGVQHSVFRYDYPKTDVTTEAVVYPGLTTWGRVRAEIDISASREVVKDFTIVLSFYDSYDSDPSDPTAAKNDYGLVTSLGWTF